MKTSNMLHQMGIRIDVTQCAEQYANRNENSILLHELKFVYEQEHGL